MIDGDEFAEDYGDEFAEDYGYSSDSDLEDVRDGWRTLQNAVAEDATQPEVQDLTDSLAIASEGKIVCEDHDGCVKQGKVVKIPDVAFVT